MNYFQVALLHSIALSGLVHAAETPASSATPTASTESAQTARQNIVGKVVDSAGKPVAGATVFVFEGWPKKGDYNYCPTCFSDCGKQCVTDASGAFHLDDLDPTLGFNLISTQKNFSPMITNVENPGAKPVTVKLKKQTGGDTPARRYKGRVLDPDGTPVWGAKIEPLYNFTGEPLDKIVVSEGDGTFTVNSSQDIPPERLVQFTIKTHESGTVIVGLKAGDTVQDIRIPAGVVVRGRLVRDGKPITGAVVGAMQTNRNIETYIGTIERRTDENGLFEIPHVPAETACQLYAVAKTFSGQGTFAPRPFKTEKNGTNLEIGDVAVTPGYTVAGKVILENGKPPKAGSHVFLSVRESASPYEALTDNTGAFRFSDIPGGLVDVRVSLPHYLPAESNGSLYRDSSTGQSGTMLRGMVSGDKTDLILAYRKGEPDYARFNSSDPKQPLAGAESLHPELIPLKVPETIVVQTKPTRQVPEPYPTQCEKAIAGHVMDKDGKPVSGAIVTVVDESVSSIRERRVQHLGQSTLVGKTFRCDENGAYKITPVEHGRRLETVVTAEGYRTTIHRPMTAPRDWTVTLEKKSPDEREITGRILDSEGRPVAASFLKLTTWKSNSGRSVQALTDANGVYQIKAPEAGDRLALEVSAPGFVVKTFQNFKVGADSTDITLERGATLSGKLLAGGKPASDIRLHVTVRSNKTNWRDYRGTITGNDGTFEIRDVPSGTDYTLQADQESLDGKGCLPEIKASTKAAGTKTDLGELNLIPGYTLAGRVVMTDGGTVPADLILWIADADERSRQDVPVDANGYFRIQSVPGTPVLFSAFPTKVLSSARNAANSHNNIATLIGTLSRDKTDLIFELERGGFEEQRKAAEEAAKLPLRGAEATKTASK